MAVLVGASGESEDLGPTGLLLMFTEKLDKWISWIACELVRSKFEVWTASLDSDEVNRQKVHYKFKTEKFRLISS